MNNSPEYIECFLQNLRSKLPQGDRLTISQQRGGGNNQVFTLELDGIPQYVMKRYFRQMSDSWDRCRTELAFLEYAVNAGVSCVPKPMVSDPEQGIAIFEYIRGVKIPAGHVKADHISQALDFFEVLNPHIGTNTHKLLLPASESCFSLRSHLDCVERRITRLLHMNSESEIDQTAVRFIRDELCPAWDRIRYTIMNLDQIRATGIDTPLSEADICISPSDFGFHNAIQTDTGRIYFIDFEYAGSDDPVKMICDFFCQPDVPIPHSYLPMFATRVLSRLDNPEMHYQRLECLLPVHTLKWCCIILNEFLPSGRARRIYAHSDLDIYERKCIQLKKARQVLTSASTRI